MCVCVSMCVCVYLVIDHASVDEIRLSGVGNVDQVVHRPPLTALVVRDAERVLAVPLSVLAEHGGVHPITREGTDVVVFLAVDRGEQPVARLHVGVFGAGRRGRGSTLCMCLCVWVSVCMCVCVCVSE